MNDLCNALVSVASMLLIGWIWWVERRNPLAGERDRRRDEPTVPCEWVALKEGLEKAKRADDEASGSPPEAS